MTSKSISAKRIFFETLDEGIVQGRPAFLYATKYDAGGDRLTLRHYLSDTAHQDLEINAKENSRRIHTANLVTDQDYGVHAAVWFYDGTDSRVAYFAYVNQEPGRVTVSDPVEIEFPNIQSPLMVRLVPSGKHFFFVCVDGRDDQPWRFCLATLDAATLAPTSRVTQMTIEVAETYINPEQRQRARNLTLVADGEGGAFLQLVNGLGNIETYRLSATTQNEEVGYAHLYDVAKDGIGYHATLFDRNSYRLVTCFSSIAPVDTEHRVFGYSQKIFSSSPNAPAEGNGGIRQQFVQLNVRPGFFFRPQISLIPPQSGREGSYLVSWEGVDCVRFAEFTPALDLASVEHSVDELRLPGNHRTIATPSLYGVCYQDDCLEPRFTGLDFASRVIPR
jgi:hypothetical protein